MASIDPFNITNYKRTEAELETFWLFCLAVAGKKATVIASKIDEFLEPSTFDTPFDYILYLDVTGELKAELNRVKMGKYSLLQRGFVESALRGNQWLRNASADDLKGFIVGAGYKTSRFFTLHSRENEQVAVIDTHTLKYLNHIGVKDVPKTIPANDRYLELEQILLKEAKTKI